MTFTNNIPVSGQTLGQTQAGINTNFTIIRDTQAINHGDYDTANEGKHLFMQMPEQASAPTTAVNEGALYTKVDTASTPTTQIFYRNENNGTEVQLTGFGGSIPIILTGTATINASTNAITAALPQNIYGYIIMWSTTSPFPIQMGSFFTDTTQAHGYSNRVVRNSSAIDNPVELINSPAADLKLYGTRDDFGTLSINWRLHYWAQ